MLAGRTRRNTTRALLQLDFSVLAGVRPLIQTMPLEKASEAYRRMKSGDVKFRMVLTMGETGHAH